MAKIKTSLHGRLLGLGFSNELIMAGSSIILSNNGTPVTLSGTELAFTDGVTAGTVTASKAVVVNSTLDIATFRNMTMNGTFTHSGTTGSNIIALTDNLADALSVKEASTAYLTFVTTDSGEKVQVKKTMDFPGTTGNNKLTIPDNLADAFSILEGTNAYLTFVSTDSSEAINAKQRLTVTDGVSSGTARVVGGMAFSDVATTDTVSAVTSSNTFVSFAQTYSVPANTLKSGSMMRVRAMVSTNDVTGTVTLTCNIRIGGSSMIATTAVDPGSTSDHHMLEFDFLPRAAPGGTASCVGYGVWRTNTGGTIATGTAILAATNFATNGALVVDVQAKWSASNASTSARLEMLNVEII